MTRFVTRSALGGFGLVAILTLAGGVASSQDNTSGTPPPWPSLVRCAEMGDEGDRLNCYDAAMRSAGYAPKPAAVSAARHRLFGLATPKIALGRKSKDKVETAKASSGEDENNVTVTLGQVARLHDDKLLLITTEGAIWEQTDQVEVQPGPKEGQSMTIRRGPLGGFFCDVNKWKSVRCTRTR